MLSVLPADAFKISADRKLNLKMDHADGLPNELILDIFELGATSDRNTAVSLLQSTSWARKLLLPLLYECVVLYSWSRVDQFKHTIRSDDTRKSVRRLSIAVGEYPIVEILSACQSLTSLTVSSTLFRKQTNYFLPTNLIYSPAIISPHLTHLTIDGPSYLIQPSTLPGSVTHLVFKDDAPLSGYSLKAVLTLPKLTHLAFKVPQQLLPFAPDPSPRISFLLNSLFLKGIPAPDSPVAAKSPASRDAEDPSTAITLIAVMLSSSVDTRIVETLVNYRIPNLSSAGHDSPAERNTESRKPKLNILNEHCQWWTQSEWARKGGEQEFWRRMQEFKA